MREAEAVRKAEEEKEKVEAEAAKLRAELESFRKAEEEKEKVEAETAKLRAELERLKAEIGKPKASIAEEKTIKYIVIPSLQSRKTMSLNTI